MNSLIFSREIKRRYHINYLYLLKLILYGVENWTAVDGFMFGVVGDKPTTQIVRSLDKSIPF